MRLCWRGNRDATSNESRDRIVVQTRIIFFTEGRGKTWSSFFYRRRSFSWILKPLGLIFSVKETICHLVVDLVERRFRNSDRKGHR
jgi:hypothetical protein